MCEEQYDSRFSFDKPRESWHTAALSPLSQAVNPMNKPLALGVLACALSAHIARGQAVPPNYDFQWQTIAAPNNPAYTGPDLHGHVTGRGSVPYTFRMSKLEVTTSQWLEFANTIGAIGDPYRIGEDALWGAEGGATGPNNTYHYALQSGFPGIGLATVTRISWLNAARYCNWLQNSKAASISALTSGVYDLRAYEANPSSVTAATIQRSPTAQFWIPSLDESLKAGHFDPNGNGPGQSRWWQYSTTSDTAPVTGVSPIWGGTGQTNAGLWPINPSAPYQTFLSDQYPTVQSPWGLLDTSGGASEWLEDTNVTGSIYREYVGSTLYNQSSLQLDRIDEIGATFLTGAFNDLGLRIASAIPAPQAFCGCIVVLALGQSRKRI
jgi:hypothetical protein